MHQLIHAPGTPAAAFSHQEVTEADIQQELARFAPECHAPAPASQRTATIIAVVCITLSIVAVGWMGAMVGGAPVALGLAVFGVMAGVLRALPTLYVLSRRHDDRVEARMRIQARRAGPSTRHA